MTDVGLSLTYFIDYNYLINNNKQTNSSRVTLLEPIAYSECKETVAGISESHSFV